MLSRVRILPVCLALFLFSSALFAQAQRTFVASTGNDANPCSRSLPCRNFTAAITAAADGGEVVVLDSAGYGALTIGKSITLVAPSGVYAGISGFTGSAVTINAPSGTVVLSGLTVNGVGGSVGIMVTAAGHVHVSDVVVSNFTWRGLQVASAVQLYVQGSTFRRNYGNIDLSTMAGTVYASFDHDAIIDTTQDNGVSVDPTGPGAAKAVFSNCAIEGNAFHGVAVATFGTATTCEVTIQSCTIAFNLNVGVGTFNAGTAVRIAQTMVTGNGTGISVFAGTVTSFGNNEFSGNVTDVSGSVTTVPQN